MGNQKNRGVEVEKKKKKPKEQKQRKTELDWGEKASVDTEKFRAVMASWVTLPHWGTGSPWEQQGAQAAGTATGGCRALGAIRRSLEW